jgi:F0F1-type ATP synthase assembly protein I
LVNLPGGAAIRLSGAKNVRNCQVSTFPTPMTDPRPARADAVTAGTTLIGGMVAGAGIGFGLGSLVGLAVPLGLLGLFAGLIAGFLAVYARYKRI